MPQRTIELAGPAGDLGARILTALGAAAAAVRALVRPDDAAGDAARLAALCAEVARADARDVDALAACRGPARFRAVLAT